MDNADTPDRLAGGAPATVLAEAALALGRRELAQAERLVRSRLAAEPRDVEALRLLAAVAEAAGTPLEAERCLRKAIEVAPASAPAHVDLAGLLSRLGRPDEALALLDAVLTRSPESVWAWSLKAAVLETERRSAEALAVHEALIARAPRASIPWTNYGRALNAVGRLEDAVCAYRRALELDPANGFAWWGLANLRTVRLGPEDVTAMEGALARVADDLGRTQLLYALGKALGDQRRFEPSFRCYERGNALRGAHAAYDADALSRFVSEMEALFTAEFLAARRECGCAAPDPIFIVGMPRSGSTLVEQILASHPLVEGAGELTELGELAARMTGEIGQLSPGQLAELGESYLAATRRRRRTDRPFFTDKMPANWRHVGLIHLMLPGAKIVDVRRDPLACCVSGFTTYFNRQTSFPASLGDLGRHYRDYVRAVGHFERLLPGRIHRLRYEDLVADLEGETRRLLDYLGLPFDAACLRFHETQREVHTPSAQQVRRPINRDGLDAWRDYEAWLAPLKDVLGAGFQPGR